MENPRPADSPSVRTHKNQLAWQILVPFLIFTAIILAVAVLVGTGTSKGNRTLADISTIWLIIPLLIFALFLTFVLGALVYALARILKIVPTYTGKAQDFIARLASGAVTLADGIAKPFVWTQQAGAVLKKIFRL
jgi:amino acid transporter